MAKDTTGDTARTMAAAPRTEGAQSQGTTPKGNPTIAFFGKPEFKLAASGKWYPDDNNDVANVDKPGNKWSRKLATVTFPDCKLADAGFELSATIYSERAILRTTDGEVVEETAERFSMPKGLPMGKSDAVKVGNVEAFKDSVLDSFDNFKVEVEKNGGGQIGQSRTTAGHRTVGTSTRKIGS